MDRKNEVQVHVVWFLGLRLAGPICRSLLRKHGPQESVTGTGTSTSVLFIGRDYRRAIAQLALRRLGRLLVMVFWDFLSVSNRVE